MFVKNNRNKYFAIPLVFVFIFSPVSFSSIIALSQTVSIEEITGYQEWNQSRTIDKNVVVKTGATLVIGKGVEINFTQPWIGIQVKGNLLIQGTVKEPTVIKSSSPTGGFSLIAEANSSVTIRNAEISSGGSEAFIVGMMNTALAGSYKGAVQVNGGSVDIQNTTFRNNLYAVVVASSSANVRVNRSRFIENNFDVESYDINDDFRYNWWGTASGPTQTCYGSGKTYTCYYDKIDGNFNRSSHLTQEFFRDPVIIVPGILGSWKMTNASNFVLDPLLGLYDPLIQTLIDNGYERDKNLFVFPYEWRKSNVDTAKLLQTKIDEISTQINWPKIDIVAHSMGGLVAREYIETLNGGKNIDQLITLGTPQSGSPESYLAWEGGDFGLKLKDFLLEKIFQQEAEENGYATIFDYLTKAPVLSVRELLPSYSYLRDQTTNTMRGYPTGYPRNIFLEKLQETGNLSKLKSVEFTNIVGKLKQDKVITGFRVSSPTTISIDGVELDLLWGHGKPDGYDDLLGDHGIESGVGDGTVPLSSAENVASDELIELPSAHNELPTDAAKIVYNRLTGLDALADSSQPLVMQSMFIVQVYSPIDIQVISPSGKRMGKNFETGGLYDEIADAFYTGYDTQNEFITIPNPEEGEYKILTEGTGDGEYRIEGTLIHENSDTSEATESMVTIRGIAETGKQEEKKVTVENNTVTGEDADTVAPMTEIVLAGAEGLNDWHTGDVSVSLSAMDNDGGSGVEKIEYSLDNGAIWNVYSESLTISREGVSVIQYFSTDKAGNKEAVKTREIKIDKTAPEAKVTFNPVTQKLSILGADSLGGVVAVVMRESIMGRKGERGESEKGRGERGRVILITTLTDQAGHTTILSFEKRKDKQNRIDLVLQSVSYDGVMTNFQDSGIQYKWQLNRKGKYQLLASHLKTANIALESHYFSKRNETWIMERPRDLADEGDDDSDRRPLRKKLPGMVIPAILTEQGRVKIAY
jgi:pimeloyl-ACP methyl ester carboxylesterase